MSVLNRIKNTLLGGGAFTKAVESSRSPAPFIVGVGRSGTTLLRLMLDAHPEMAIPPETHFLPQVIRAAKDLPNPGEKFVEIVTNYRTWGDYGLDEKTLSEEVSKASPELGSALRTFYKLYAARFGKVRWGDKTPLYVRHMTGIQSVLPEARFIHVIRDGRDVALSNKQTWFGPDSVRESAVWWRDWIISARNQAEYLDHYLEVRYENLVEGTEPTLKKICDFLELSWSPKMLDYYLSSDQRMREIRRDIPATKGSGMVRGHDRTGIHAMTSNPPDRGRIGRWRSEMDPAELRVFEEEAGQLMDALNYERHCI